MTVHRRRCTPTRPRCTGQAVGNACTCPPRLYHFAADVLATLVERRRTYGELALVLFRVVLTTPATLSRPQRLRLDRALAFLEREAWIVASHDRGEFWITDTGALAHRREFARRLRRQLPLDWNDPR